MVTAWLTSINCAVMDHVGLFINLYKKFESAYKFFTAYLYLCAISKWVFLVDLTFKMEAIITNIN